MSDKNRILKEIKSLLFSAETNDDEAKEFTETKSGDLIVRVDGEKFEKDADLLIVTEDGVIPAADGTYVLEEEEIILTVINGTIEDIEEVKEEDKAGEDEKVVDEEDNNESFEDEKEKEEDKKEEDKKEEDKKEDEFEGSDLEERVSKLESLLEELLNSTKDVAEFSSAVSKKIDSFIKDTPANMEFKSVKSQFENSLNFKKQKVANNLEDFKNIRKK